MNENQKPLILVVEDGKRLNLVNRYALESEGYAVQSAFTLAEAHSILKNVSPDVILLDVKLPDGSGFDLCREIRETTTAHIIFLTSVMESSGEMEGLIAGGDDYLRKPYRIELLRERVKSVLRRRDMESNKASPQTITKGSLTLDIVASQVFVNGVDLLLQPKEFALLLFLVQNEGKTMSAEYIYEKVWRQSMAGDKNAVQSAIYRLRKKIEHTGYDISMTRRKGYTFVKN